jgi:hypothetical protein
MSVWQAKAAVRFPRSHRRGRIHGDGRWVLAIACGVPKILLYPAPEARQRKLIALDRGCGMDCRDQHELFDLGDSSA